MRTAEDVVKELFNEGFTTVEIMCSLDKIKRESNKNNTNTYSLKSVAAKHNRPNGSNNQ